MGVLNFILRVIGWLVTIVLQIVASFMIIFLASVIFAGVDNTSRTGWLATLFMVWVGYIVGINLIGWIALRWVWHGVPALPSRRLLWTALAGLIPLLILLPIGYSVPVGGADSAFYNLVTNNWQPVLAQASLFTSIVGYYAPGLFVRKPLPVTNETAN